MNPQNELDGLLVAALGDGPSTAPDRVIHGALEHARTHPRHFRLPSFLRTDPMAARSPRSIAPLRSAALVGILVLALVAGFAAAAAGLFRDRSVIVPPVATPTPAASASAPPTASSHPSPVPSPTAISVDLIEHVGADATILITDRSGTLVNAGSGNPGDGASVPAGAVAVTPVVGDPSSVLLTWSGSPCDTSHRLIIDPDGLTMAIERPVCQGDAIAIDHVLRLTFDHVVDSTRVIATVQTLADY
jgi:hypothetical protein